jgi:hypothetical protein
VAVFQAPNRIYGGADALSQGFLGQISAAAGESQALPDPAQGSFDRKWDWMILHGLYTKLDFLKTLENQIWMIIGWQASIVKRFYIYHPYLIL